MLPRRGLPGPLSTIAYISPKSVQYQSETWLRKIKSFLLLYHVNMNYCDSIVLNNEPLSIQRCKS